jgi:hypothetical protein
MMQFALKMSISPRVLMLVLLVAAAGLVLS